MEFALPFVWRIRSKFRVKAFDLPDFMELAREVFRLLLSNEVANGWHQLLRMREKDLAGAVRIDAFLK